MSLNHIISDQKVEESSSLCVSEVDSQGTDSKGGDWPCSSV